MLLGIPLDAVILSLAMEPWFHCWDSWMSTQSFQCLEMPRGLYQTSAEASHNLPLIRYLSFPVHWFEFKHRFLAVSFWHFIISEFLWAGEAGTSCSWASRPFQWWRSPDRCLLGSLLSFWWYKWQNPSCDRGRCLWPTYSAPPVSLFYFVDVCVLSCFQLYSFMPTSICFLFQTSISFSAHPCPAHSWKYCDRRWYSNSGKSFLVLFLAFKLLFICKL